MSIRRYVQVLLSEPYTRCVATEHEHGLWVKHADHVTDKEAEVERLTGAVEVGGENIRALWDALRMVRDAIEEVGPVGALPSVEHEGIEPHEVALTLVGGIERLTDKGIKYDLDQAGIDQREVEAVKLVELRAEVARLTAERDGLAKALHSTYVKGYNQGQRDYEDGVSFANDRARAALAALPTTPKEEPDA